MIESVYISFSWKKKNYILKEKNEVFPVMLMKIMFLIITYWVLSMNKNQNKIVSLRMFSYNIDFQYIA